MRFFLLKDIKLKKQEMVKKGIAQQLRVAQGKIEGPQEDGQTSVFYYNGNEFVVPTDKWTEAFNRYKQQTDKEHDEVIETLASQRTDQALRIGILPGTGWTRGHLRNAHADDAALKRLAVDRVAVSQQPSRRAAVRKGFHHLLRGPVGRGMGRDGQAHDSAPCMREQHQNEQHAAGERWDGEKVHRDQSGDVIGEKRAPGLRVGR